MTFTSVATGTSVAAEVVMPGPLNRGFVLAHQRNHLRQFYLREPVGLDHTHRRQPELRGLAVARHVHVHGFTAIAREEEQPEAGRSAAPWDSPSDCASFTGNTHLQLRLTTAHQPRRVGAQ